MTGTACALHTVKWKHLHRAIAVYWNFRTFAVIQWKAVMEMQLVSYSFIHRLIHLFIPLHVHTQWRRCCSLSLLSWADGSFSFWASHKFITGQRQTLLNSISCCWEAAAQTLQCILIAASLNSQIRSWSRSLACFIIIEIQFPWQQPSIHSFICQLVFLRSY